jgi:hypothetical protein
MALPTYQDSLVDTLLSGDFFEAVGMADLPLTEKTEMLATMTETVCARVFMQVYESLEAHDQEAIKTVEQEEFQDFLAKRGIDLVACMVQEALRHRLEVIMVYKTAMTPDFIAQQDSLPSAA